jgi:hypothetical protein
MAYRQHDYVLRLIEQIAAVLARARKLREQGQYEAALADLERAAAELLGPTGALLGRVDAATAAQLLGDWRRLGAWGQLLAEEAEVRDAQGHDAAGAATRRRALELTLESLQRFDAGVRPGGAPGDDTGRAEIVRLVAALTLRVDPITLADRYQQALRRVQRGEGA